MFLLDYFVILPQLLNVTHYIFNKYRDSNLKSPHDESYTH
jgi:hypothetical protein